MFCGSSRRNPRLVTELRTPTGPCFFGRHAAGGYRATAKARLGAAAHSCVVQRSSLRIRRVSEMLHHASTMSTKPVEMLTKSIGQFISTS